MTQKSKYPQTCPITGRPFFMELMTPEGVLVPTYGGPFDSYTIPTEDEDHNYTTERYDHDEGGWVGSESIDRANVFRKKNVLEKAWEFWKPIICEEDGTINIEQLKKELADFSTILEEVPKVYCHITGSKLSYATYPAATVIAVADQYAMDQEEENERERPIHSGWDIRKEDKVFVELPDGTAKYFLVHYDDDAAAYMLIPFTDKHFTTTLEIDGSVKAEFLHVYGFELLERVEDFEFDQLP